MSCESMIVCHSTNSLQWVTKTGPLGLRGAASTSQSQRPQQGWVQGRPAVAPTVQQDVRTSLMERLPARCVLRQSASRNLLKPEVTRGNVGLFRRALKGSPVQGEFARICPFCTPAAGASWTPSNLLALKVLPKALQELILPFKPKRQARPTLCPRNCRHRHPGKSNPDHHPFLRGLACQKMSVRNVMMGYLRFHTEGPAQQIAPAAYHLRLWKMCPHQWKINQGHAYEPLLLHSSGI